jgi:hypothetical protein
MQRFQTAGKQYQTLSNPKIAGITRKIPSRAMQRFQTAVKITKP